MAISDHIDFTKIETERIAVFAKLEIEQKKRSIYLQCLTTPVEKMDGSNTVIFDLTRKPADEVEDWRALDIDTIIFTGTRCQYCCHRYEGPQGNGFILSCLVEYSGVLWQYEEHFGPESRSDIFGEWVEVIEI